MEELTRISKILNLHEYISSLPNGYQHYFEANNNVPNNVSKKIPLARALYQSPPLLLVDDIWSSFTKDEIHQILNYIKKLNSTAIIVSNHLPVLESSDRCFFLNEQGLKEIGKVEQHRIPAEIQNIIWS
jgi:ABC-type bacteriocin/lantibiotic exporter with double-glycine peptidase domain